MKDAQTTLKQLLSRNQVSDPRTLAEMARAAGVAPRDIYQFIPMMIPCAQINYDTSTTAGTVNLHTHSFYEILFVCRGEQVEYLLGNNRYALRKGDVLLIPPDMPHRPLFLNKLTHPYERFALWLETDFFEKAAAMFPELSYALEQCKQKDSYLLRSTEATYSGLHAGFSNLWQETQLQRFGWEAAVGLGAFVLMAHISRTFYYRDTAAAHTEQRSLFDEAFRYIDMHLAEPLTLQSVAEHFHVSRSTISHVFQKRLGISFYRCVIQRRLIAAKNGILHGEQMREAAERCGFSDYASFYRLFKKEYGISPRQFRQLHDEGAAST